MKVKKITFGNIPFRMFSNIEFNIAERITVIAGHNGIGKSTLLGLIANGSELKTNNGTTIFNKAFQAQLHELFFLDKDRDYVEKRNNKPSFSLTYSCESKKDLIKTCNVSKHREKKGLITQYRLKVVPRGTQDGWEVGAAAKVTIPTLFLSMSRMLPIGEFQNILKSELLEGLSEEDKMYVKDKFKSIIDNKIVNSTNITRQELKGTTKNSLLPEFEHSTRTISLGQDSLSSIITAFASFNKLKREKKEKYNGGILLIDEIDAGFHPRAQIKLINLIKQEARNLNLQVIMTSHSLTVIKEVLNISDTTARSGQNIDTVIYIEDVLRPRLMSNPTYIKIKNDMLGILPKTKEELPEIKIYFEDEEAKWFFNQVINNSNIDIKSEYRHNVILIAAKLGCDNLKSLFEVDNYFKSIIIIFDNDVLTKEDTKNIVDNNKNILALPAIIKSNNNKPEKRTPEYQIYNYINKLLYEKNNLFWGSLPTGYNMEMIKDAIVDTFPSKATDRPIRELRKDWFKEHQEHFEKINLIKYFCSDNKDIITSFISDLKIALDSLLSTPR